MHKENDKSQNKSEKTNKSKSNKPTQSNLSKLNDLDQSPIRSADSTIDNLAKFDTNSTPVSAFASFNRPNYSFNNSPMVSLNDSGYTSNNSYYEDLHKNAFNYVPFNSPLSIQSTNPLTFNIPHFQSFYYNPVNMVNINQRQHANTSFDSTTKTQFQFKSTERTAKSVFRPFE